LTGFFIEFNISTFCHLKNKLMYKFFQKLEEILKKNRYEFNAKPHHHFLKFLRFNMEARPLQINTIQKAIQKYNEENSVNFFLKRTKFSKKSIVKGSRYLVEMIGRKHSPQFKITTPHGKGLSPKLRDRMSPLESGFLLSFSPVKSLTNRPGGTAEINGQVYKQAMSTHELSLWRKVTPSKPAVAISSELLSPEKEKTNENVLFYFSKPNLPKHVQRFEFSVTLNELLSRKGVARPISQTQVMGGQTAQEVLKKLGALIYDKQSYHWAHRQGWAMGGPQSQYNLDPTTAGSNYDTLFRVEQPIYDLLMNGDVEKVFVKGLVILHSLTPVPKQIIYQISTKDIPSPIYVYIEPMSHRIPTVDESILSEQLIRQELKF
jgi:hypothetical protein